MMRHISRVALAAIVVGFMVGCDAPMSMITLTPFPTPAPTRTLSPIVAAFQTLAPEGISNTSPTVTETPSITPTNAPIAELTTRQPTIEQLDAYLRYYYPEEIDFWGNGPPNFARWLGDVDWIYTDVSGDGEVDLIVPGGLYVAVMVWMGDRYSIPYQDAVVAWKYQYTSQVYLEDWTDDGVPEVVFETYGDTGGTGYVSGGWGRRIIYCHEDGCNEAWHGSMGGLANDSNSGGIARTDTQLKLVTQEDGEILLEETVQSFVLFCCFDWSEQGSGDGLKTEAYVNTYRWTGSIFEHVGKQVLQEEVRIIPPPIAPATNNFGAVASITSEYNRALGMHNNNCQLAVDGKNVGELFGCRDFVTIQWRDITGDNQVELVVIALSAVWLVVPHEELIAADCYHQRLIAYGWTQQDGIGNQIANVMGCVVQSDLYGVRLEDLDGDGIQEIIAAARVTTEHEPYDWFEFDNHDNIYRWNGSEYVYSETVTRE